MEVGDFSSLPDIPMLNPGFQRVTAGEGYVEMTCGRTGGDDAHQSWGILYIEDPTVQISWWGLEFYADQEYISDRVGTYGEYNMYLERIRDRYYFYCWGE